MAAIIRHELPPLVLRLFLFGLLWRVMIGSGHGGGMVAVAVILAATLVSRVVWPPRQWRINFPQLLVFIPWFLWNSLLAGIHVAWRAFHPRMPLHPELIEIPLREDEQSAILLAWTVSLIPGTACVCLKPGRAVIHVLDSRSPYREKLRVLSHRLDRLCARRT